MRRSVSGNVTETRSSSVYESTEYCDSSDDDDDQYVPAYKQKYKEEVWVWWLTGGFFPFKDWLA